MLELESKDGDMSFYYKIKRYDKIPQEAMVVYLDDTLETGNDEFKNMTENEQTTLESDLKEFAPYIFSVININKTETGHFNEQENYSKHLEPLKSNASFDYVQALKHKLTWLSHTRP